MRFRRMSFTIQQRNNKYFPVLVTGRDYSDVFESVDIALNYLYMLHGSDIKIIYK